jgi:hypothetical protein
VEPVVEGGDHGGVGFQLAFDLFGPVTQRGADAVLAEPFAQGVVLRP